MRGITSKRKQDENNQTPLTLSRRRFFLCVVALGAAFVAATARAEPASAQSGLPAHSYSAHECNHFDYWGNYITVFPTRLATFDGIDMNVVNGPSNPYENMRQSIYYQLWVYSYNTGSWTRSGYKRVRGGNLSEPEQFKPGFGWVLADGSPISGNLAIGDKEVGVRVGGGWQYVEVETYWEQPSYGMNTTAPNPWSGGWQHFDVLGYCRF